MAQCWAKIGEARSHSFVKDTSDNSARSAVWPPAVDDVALLGWCNFQLTETHSIQPACSLSVDSPLMPSTCKYTSIAISCS